MPTESPFTANHFINRELSWLAFNERVLEEAARPGLPVLERAKFLAITASNLDEFYMVRVGGLQLLRDQGLRGKDISGLTVTQQLDQIKERTTTFIARQYAILNEQVVPELRDHGIRRLNAWELTPLQRTLLHDYFMEHIHPVLSPIEIDPKKLPSLPALNLVLLCLVTSEGNEDRQVMFVLPANLPRHIAVADAEAGQHAYLNLEDLLEAFLNLFFTGEQVKGTARFRLSRNSDIAVDDKAALDLASEMEDILDARRLGATIRVEIEKGAPRALERTIRALAAQKSANVFTIPGELDLRAYFAISGLSGFDDLKVRPWESQSSTAIEPGESLFTAIRRKDILLHHPYESFDPVVQLLEEAANDPDVVAIKQILYRTAKNSRLISALIKAAEAGKHVTVLVELKARFDEARNLERAEDLLAVGAQIIYGVRGLKTHAKICLIMRREAGHMLRYMHFGTGNYNEATAKLYTDISYLTCRADYGRDASTFFNTVTGRSRFQHFEKLSMAPFGLRERLLTMIASEADRAKQGEPAEIMLKMNSLEDREMIEALYAASQAGVSIRLNIRGLCCLKPGIKGISENIRVVSIIDRYLEHARIFCFRQGGSPVVFIASADFMNRNLSKRVELLIPIDDGAARKRLISILETFFTDNVQARVLGPDGSYTPVPQESNKPIRAQESFAKEAAKRAKQHSQTPDTLVPHLPKVEG
ncbi:MAG: polyphosphate kinase 1 [Verrucomicrobiaceae bacterium]